MVRKVLWGRLRKNGKLKVKLKQKSKYNRISKGASNTGIGCVGRKTKGENIFFFVSRRYNIPKGYIYVRTRNSTLTSSRKI